MAQIINQSTTHVNALISLSHFDVNTHVSTKLTQSEFNASHEKKRAWVKASVQERKLRLNEPRVVEQLAFLTDPVTGIGSPSIGLIQEKLIENGHGYIGYTTIREILARAKDKGAISIKANYNNKSGNYKDSNTYKLIGYEYKLANHSSDSGDSLNVIYLQDNINNITYSEYESVFPNSIKEKNLGLNTPIHPQLTPIQPRLPKIDQESKSEPILKSDRYVSREALEEPLQELVNEEIEPNQQIAVTNTLKRLIAPLETKIELTKKLSLVSKKTAIRNIGGMIVYLFKKMMESKPAKREGNQMKNHMDVFKLNEAAETLALGRLKAKGIVDPRKDCSQDYEAIRGYDSQLATMLALCLRELTTNPTPEDKKSEPRKTWAERAYS